MNIRIRQNRSFRPQRQSGVALVVGLLLLLVLTILAISGMTTATLELQMAGNEQYQERAFQAAEAGVEQAMAAGIYTTSVAAVAGQYNYPVTGEPEPIRGQGVQTADCDDQSGEASGQCEYFIRFDQAAGITPVPTGGHSLGTGLQAYHFVVDAGGVAECGAQAQNQTTFYIIGPGGTPESPWLIMLKGLGLIALVIISAKWIVPQILYHIARTADRELFLLTIVAICLSVAWASSLAGLSLGLGAFLAGLIISESPYSHQAFGNIMPLRDAFTSFFFISIGMLLDLNYLLQNPIYIILAAVAAMSLKALIAGFAVSLLGLPLRISVLVGLALCQIGEFSFILSKTEILAKNHRFNPNDERAVTMQTWRDMDRIFGFITEGMRWFLLIMGTLTLSIGGVGLMNVMLVAVTERTREIGIRKAMGARRRHILAQFLLEGLAIAMVGGLIGYILAEVVAWAIGVIPFWSAVMDDKTGQADIHMLITPAAVLTAGITLTIVGLLSGFLPAFRASRLSPIEALRYE